MMFFRISLFLLCVIPLDNFYASSELRALRLKEIIKSSSELTQNGYSENYDDESDLKRAVDIMVWQGYLSVNLLPFDLFTIDSSLSWCYNKTGNYWLSPQYNSLSKVFDKFYLGDAIDVLDKKRYSCISELAEDYYWRDIHDEEYKRALKRIDIIYNHIKNNFFERDKALRRATLNRIDYENNLIIKAMITDEIDFAKVHEAIEKYTSYSNKKSTIYGLRPIEYVIGQHDFNSDNRWMDVVHSLLEKGADINIPDGPRNRTLIFKVIEEGQTDYKSKHVQLVQLLLNFNCDLSIQDELGMTPYDFALHCSKKFCSDEYKTIIAMIKMRSDVPVDTQDDDGNTKLHRQMRNIGFWCFGNHVSNTFYLLRVCGADTSIQNHEGKKAIDVLEPTPYWWKKNICIERDELEIILNQTREQRYQAHIEKNKKLMNAVKTTAQILIAAQQKNKKLKADLHAELLKKYPEITA